MTINKVAMETHDPSTKSDNKNSPIGSDRTLEIQDESKEKVVASDEFSEALEKLIQDFATLPENWKDLTVREQRDWAYKTMNRGWKNLPRSLTFLVVGGITNKNFDRSANDARPDWLDHEKFLRGQRFAANNLASISFSELLGLYSLFSFENGLKPLIVTGRSSDPFMSFKRYLSTATRMKNWYTSDVWTVGTRAYKDIRVVNKMHANIKNKLMKSSIKEVDESSKIELAWSPTRASLLEDFRVGCPAPAPGQSPLFSQENQFIRPKGLNQAEMAATQFGFIGMVILFPERIGIHGATDEDLDAFCHVWRSLGYLLGLEDEFNFCNGSLEEVKQRSRDFLEYWVKLNLRSITPEWEHVLRCLMEGVGYYFPLLEYEQGLLYLTELLDIPMPRLRASLSYRSWFFYNVLKFLFLWISRLPGVSAIMNRTLNMCMERALKFTDEELEGLRKKSKITLSKGIADTIALDNKVANVATNGTYKAPYLVFLLACLAPIVVKDFIASMLLRVNIETSLLS